MSTVIDDVKFLTPSTFSCMLITMMRDKNISHIDAILELCRERNIEIESIPELLTPQLKKLIKNEAVSLNLMRKKSGSRKLNI